MRFEELTATVSPTPNITPTQELIPDSCFTTPFAAREYDKEKQEAPEIFLPYGRQFAEKHCIQIAATIGESMRLRGSGVMAMTLRELDTAARGRMDLGNTFLRDCLLTDEYLIVEGSLGDRNSGYDLRALYNRMLKYKQEHWDSFSEQRKEEARRKMAEVLTKLDKISLPAWKEEIEHGFHPELCKPEYMTQEQYDRERHRVIKYNPPDPAFETTEVAEAAT